ncbi:mandelate racemase/muconate lactonizing enzyme family protein [Haloplanus aerogenes]|uniref:o-succinylbenzoate synthase n=1 Tax=Haloplanus aerogenes TaxID=660522 RepID=A0A3G8R2F6_9EURY|nr:enolase C-terminal domain-like protein [Haloplanus aerogenes]AZH27204.1 o-succinylbenzoate synthase [Haloplanus aerogenes]
MDRRPFTLDLARPLTTANGTISRREGDLVRITADGVRGVGEATPLPGWTESLANCRTALDVVADAGADTLLAAAAASPREPLAAATTTLTDALADAPAARHAVESAALDALGRREGRPLAALLTDDPAARVPVNATIGDASPEETADAAQAAVDAGFSCLKVKVGAGKLDRDVTRLRVVREAVGPDVTLRADANGAWARETARTAVDAFASLDLAYLEQPLAADDLSGHATLRSRGVAIALDETLAAVGVDDVFDADAADVLILKPMALGGPARAHAVARRARRAGVDPVVTTTVDAAPARTAAVHVAAAIPDVRPCGLATGDALDEDLAPDPAPVEAGSVTVPAGPGVAGAAFDGLF